MVSRLLTKASWTYSDFIVQAKEAFKQLPSYAGFLCSEQIRTVILAIALAASRQRGSKSKYDLTAATTYFKLLVDANRQLSVEDKNLLDIIGPMEDDQISFELEDRPVQVLARHGFLRGVMNSVLSFIDGEIFGFRSKSYFLELDIFDIFRLKGHLTTCSEYWNKIPKYLKRRYSEEDPLFVVSDLRHGSYPQIWINPRTPFSKSTTVCFSKDFSVKTGDAQMNQVLDSIINMRNLGFHWRSMNWGTDFRIPRFYLEYGSGGFVIGDWALVAQYLHEKDLEENTQL
jgi:hypothetical protein